MTLSSVAIVPPLDRLLAQTSPGQEQPQPDANDRFQCIKIPTMVDGLEYDKTLKCETKDAICYIMEGFAMSCVPKLLLPLPEIK